MVHLSRHAHGTRTTPAGLHSKQVPLVVIVAALMIGGLGTLAGAGLHSPPAPPGSPGAVLPLVGTFAVQDGGSLTISNSSPPLSLTDTVQDGNATNITREYFVRVAVNYPDPLLQVEVLTNPTADWSFPDRIPSGPDNLPPVGAWSWSVYQDGANVTGKWSRSVLGSSLSTTIGWTNATFAVEGHVHVSVPVTISAGALSGSRAPGNGLLITNPEFRSGIPPSDPAFQGLVSAVHPQLFRWGQTASQPATWNVTTGQPTFDFSHFAGLWNFSVGQGVKVLVSLPAGTWGDGNQLPPGMPLNTSQLIEAYGGSGYFPDTRAYARFVEAYVNETLAYGANITYFNIGNEVPVGNHASWAVTYTQLFNAAAEAIHRVAPSALVGSDVMTYPTELAYYAAHARGVGFLSFHYYPAHGMFNGSVFIPPDNMNGYFTDSTILNITRNFSSGGTFLPPSLAQREWFDLTGRWLPIFNTESNLNSYHPNGTDPRQQMLISGVWLGSELIDGAAQNLSFLTYFTFGWPPARNATGTAPYGGWGFGATAETGANQDQLYAPYWTYALWGSNIPSGSPGLKVASADPGTVRAFAVANGTGINLFAVNRVNVSVSVPITIVGGGYTPSSATILDQSSYQEVFNPSIQLEQLAASGVRTVPLSNKSLSPLILNGYSVAVVHFSANGTSPGGNNTTGNSTSGSGGGGGNPGTNNTNGTGTPGGSYWPPIFYPGRALGWPYWAGAADANAICLPGTCTWKASNLVWGIGLLSAVVIGGAVGWRNGGLGREEKPPRTPPRARRK